MSAALSLAAQRTYVLGVDPGLGGAIALYCLREKRLVSVQDMPTVKVQTSRKSKVHNNLDLYDLALFLDANRDFIALAVIEEVGAAPGQGVSSMFKFGFVTGAITGLVAANLIPVHTVKPAVWKVLMGLSTDKKISRLKAIETFPSHKNEFLRAKDDGRAEAALLAKFGERFYGGQRV